MSSALLVNLPQCQSTPTLVPEPQTRLPGPSRSLTTIPRWDIEALVQALNAVPMPHHHDSPDPAAAIALYAQDVQRAVPYYRELACRITSPHMPYAKELPRARGELAPQNVVVIGAAGGMGVALAKQAIHQGSTLTLLDIPGADGQPKPSCVMPVASAIISPALARWP